MTQMTITEALAERKTIEKRIAAMRKFIIQHLFRPEKMKDPLERDGGSTKVIAAKLQSISDLEARASSITQAISRINHTTTITIGDITKTIAEWLTWRRDIMPGQRKMLATLQDSIGIARTRTSRDGGRLVSAGDDAKAEDVIVNLNELELQMAIEELETVEGTLDGQLSLKNATVVIEF